jgi:hypothetical protein
VSRLRSFPADLHTQHALGGCRPVSQRSLPSDPEKRLRAIGEAIEKVVLDSYTAKGGKHAMRHRTDAEDGRRATICTKWFNALVNQHRWTPDRALSAMRLVLDDELSGVVHPAISKTTMWAPDLTLIH